MKNYFKNVLILLLIVNLSLPLVSTAASIDDAAVPTVYVIGDSTAADYGNTGEYDMTGWAQVLYNYMTDAYMIEDYAEPGASSKSFYNSDYLWGAVKPKISQGDYVLIQFGHNDSKTTISEEDTTTVPDPNRYTSPTESTETEGSFKWYLNKFAEEVREKGATPVFVTSIERRNHALLKIANPDTYNSGLYSYVTAMKALGAEIGVPVIDLHTESIDLISDYETAETGSSENLFMISVDPSTNDNTHLTQKGAMEIAKRCAELLSAHNDELLLTLKNYLVEDIDSVEFSQKLFRIEENFENPSLAGTSIANGYNGWQIQSSSPSWSDKDIVFNQETPDNMTAKFTAKIADPADENQVDKNRKLRFLNYDLSKVTGSDYFKLEYSVKSNGIANEFQVIINGIFAGNVDFNTLKIAGKVYEGSADSNGWYNIKFVGSIKSGRTYIYVNDVLHKETINSWSSGLGLIQFGLVRTICSGADIELDNIKIAFITEKEFYNESEIDDSSNNEIPTVYVIGDSTAADYGNTGEYDMTGWAQVLYNYMTDAYMIEDYAEPGASSKSFYNSDYLWGAVKPKISQGDYVLIQFGHNDSKTTISEEDTTTVPDPNRYTSPTESTETEGSFKWYLNKFAEEVREKGATPVFVTSIERRNHALLKIANPDTYNSGLYSYVTAMKALGAEIGVPVIDLHTESIDLISDYETAETGSSENLFMISVDPSTNDNTHLTQKGAMEIAKRCAELLSAHNDELLLTLKNYLVEDIDSVEFSEKLFWFKESFENSSLAGTSIANGYNDWKLQTSSDSWSDKDIVFNQETPDNMTAKFTAKIADSSDENQVDKNRKLRLLNYDLSKVARSDYFELEYSVKSNGIANEFQVIIGGIFAGNVDFNTLKIAGKVYEGSPDSNGWYNIKFVGSTKNGKTYIYVNDVLHKEAINIWTDKLGLIQFGLVRTICSGADIELDNVGIKFITEEEFCDITGALPQVIKTTKIIKENNSLTGISVEAGYVPKNSQKLIVAVFSQTEENSLKGVSSAVVNEEGAYDIFFENPVPCEDGDIVNIYFWNCENLSPINVVVDSFK